MRPTPLKLLVVGASAIALLTPSAFAVGVVLTNSGFEDGTNPEITGWTRVDGADDNSSPSNYGEMIPDLANRTAQLKSDGGNHIEQALTVTDEGALDAASFPGFIVGFEYGYRREFITAGDHDIRLAMWNLTTGNELAGTTFTIVDPGVGTNELTSASFTLSYDHTAQTAGDELAIRFTSVSDDLGFNSWQRTAVIDSVSIEAVPEPAVAVLGGLGLIGLLRRRRG